METSILDSHFDSNSLDPIIYLAASSFDFQQWWFHVANEGHC